jgi:hypothetical protein
LHLKPIVKQKHRGRRGWGRKAVHLIAARKQRGVTGRGQSQDIFFTGTPSVIIILFLYLGPTLHILIKPFIRSEPS